MTIIKHYINNRWKWDFDGSHTAYDVENIYGAMHKSLVGECLTGAKSVR